ncbi:MAG: Exodeoxyribonuclease alpha chain [Holophagaceae bacterium]|nr:Exodeoxyribonuclease alpha chain [Holophagaceae bacterium]
MPECLLPPLAGVLGGSDAQLERWQGTLQSLALPEGLLALACELAGLVPGLDPETRRELALLLLLLQVNQAQGHVLLSLEDPAPLSAFGESPRDWRGLLAREELQLLLGPGCPLVMGEGGLYSGRFFRAEEGVAQSVIRREALVGFEVAVDPGLFQQPVALSAEQREAVEAAVRAPLTLVTGGPGTGKTSIVVAMLRALVRSGLSPEEILLAAPTGKAAQRMGQAIREQLNRLGALDAVDQALLEAAEPRTLHRLLGWHPGLNGFRHHEGNPLSGKVLIVDESSMIGLELMEALLKAVPSGTRLVLLGDADQLPSVEAGRAFRDLAEARPALTRRLNHSYRMDNPASGGRHVLLVAQAINAGEPERLGQGEAALALRQSASELSRSGVELLGPEALEGFLQDWDRRWIQGLGESLYLPLKAGQDWSHEAPRIRRLVEHYDRSRVLAPLNETVERLNAFFHGRALERSRGHLEHELGILLGEPVMVLRNDYRRGLFNGDQGVVLLVEREGQRRPEVFFPRGQSFVSFPLAAIRDDLELCYAMTVHKSQGSEYQRVALLLPDRDLPLLSREILYTALTRARESVVILGERSILDLGIRRKTERASGLGGRMFLPG